MLQPASGLGHDPARAVVSHLHGIVVGAVPVEGQWLAFEGGGVEVGGHGGRAVS